MTQAETIEQWEAPRASRKRRLLAIYLDMLIFNSAWALAAYWLVPLVNQPWWRLAVFAAFEIAVLQVRLSPGLYMLSVYRYPGEDGDYLGVDPSVKSNETWKTMILATLLMNDGPKAMVRWTMFAPPKPYFGYMPDQSIGFVFETAFGAAEIFVAYAIFKMSRAGLWSALILAAAMIVSTLLSWNLFPEYVETYAVRRAEYFGREFDPQLPKVLAPFVAVGTIVVATFLGLVVLAGRRRFSNSLQET